MTSLRGPWTLLTLLVVLVGAGTLARASATAENALNARQYNFDHVRGLVAGSTAPQAIRAWQISSGTWNGQTLDGVSVVLVQELSADGRVTRANVYVSDFATPEQRKAAVTALSASHPSLFPERNSSNQRIEPAVIQIEQVDDRTAVLHLSLIA